MDTTYMSKEEIEMHQQYEPCGFCDCNYPEQDLTKSSADPNYKICPDCKEKEDWEPLMATVDKGLDRAYNQGWNAMIEIASIHASAYPLLVERLKSYKK